MRLQGVCWAVICSFLVTVASACADDDTENGMGPAAGAGGSDGGAGGSSSGAGGMGSGGTPGGDASSGVDAPSLEGTLCGKYGGPENVMTVMRENVLGEIAADCRVAGFFAPLRETTVGHIAECLGIMAQELFSCPGVVYEGSMSSYDKPCRDMKSAHLGLGISQGDFDALIEDVVVGLTAAGVEEADIMAAAPVLLGMQGDIVESTSTTPTKPTCPVPEAGAADSATLEGGATEGGATDGG